MILFSKVHRLLARFNWQRISVCSGYGLLKEATNRCLNQWLVAMVVAVAVAGMMSMAVACYNGDVDINDWGDGDVDDWNDCVNNDCDCWGKVNANGHCDCEMNDAADHDVGRVRGGGAWFPLSKNALDCCGIHTFAFSHNKYLPKESFLWYVWNMVDSVSKMSTIAQPCWLYTTSSFVTHDCTYVDRCNVVIRGDPFQ